MYAAGGGFGHRLPCVGRQAGGAQDGQYYDADYKVVDDDDQNKK